MNLDLITSIEITASAAIGIATAVLLLGRNPRIRFGITIALVLWFAGATWLGASGLLAAQHPWGLPLLGLANLGPVIASVLIVRRSATLKNALREVSLTPLVALNIVRVLGVSFLLLKASGRVAPTFASIAGWGDITVGLLAMPLAGLLATGSARPAGLLWFWNSLGLLDLIAAVGLGVASSPTPIRLIIENSSSAVMTTLPWFLIPGFLVPLLALSHLAIFWRLSRSAGNVSSSGRLRGALASAS